MCNISLMADRFIPPSLRKQLFYEMGYDDRTNSCAGCAHHQTVDDGVEVCDMFAVPIGYLVISTNGHCKHWRTKEQ